MSLPENLNIIDVDEEEMSDPPTPPSLKRSVAGKGLIRMEPDFSEEDENDEAEDQEFEIGEHPDLHYYFQQFPRVSDEDVIRMCRSYASYLASLKGPPPKRAKK